MKKATTELNVIEQSIEKCWNDSSLTDTQKRDTLEVLIYSNRTVTLIERSLISPVELQ